MLQEEYETYRPSTFLPQERPSAPIGVLDVEDPPATSAPAEQVAFEPSWYPAEQKTAPLRRKRSGRGGAAIFLTLVLALILGVGLFAGWEFAGNRGSATTTTTAITTSASSSIGTSIESLQEAAIAKVEPSVVELKVTTAQGQQIGSGVIIDTNGDIVTNNHVVNGEQNIAVLLSNGSTEQGQLVGTVLADDLAVVRIQPFAHMVVAQIANSSSLVVGQEVLAIGNPLGITETATRGIVSALNRSVTEPTGSTISNAIQTDAAINPGNSGGALVNLQGQLVGIPTLTAVNSESNTAANGLSFAIPSNLVLTAVQQILQG